MGKEFKVKFVKDKDLKRFHTTGVLTSYSRNMFVIHLLEEVSPILQEFTIVDGSTSDMTLEDGDAINYIHAALSIAPENLPNIIDSLQILYDNYISQSDGE
ncbi:hypothetical protein [Paenibacillus polymyxa]|uniref:Uncharacterized protein n=1 Tax=Paenibacillus polymyxa TaxID=1406 RepID=A0ABX2ZEJ9_PAEPO|nr:hypothetical protein [Paenibacillus polymyxa]ODA08741.1 hypothetical protein A7312_04885 [Paenibacillus polymyxa]